MLNAILTELRYRRLRRAFVAENRRLEVHQPRPPFFSAECRMGVALFCGALVIGCVVASLVAWMVIE